MLKQYLLFAGDNYYPCGGWGDFVEDFDSEVEALKWLAQSKEKYDWYHVVDTNIKQEI